MAKYRVAYGLRENINSAIASGTIPPGTMILTENSDEIFFYDLEGNLKTYENKYKFANLKEAEEWVAKYNCQGQIFSIHEEDKCSLYIVGYDNKLEKFSGDGSNTDTIGFDYYYETNSITLNNPDYQRVGIHKIKKTGNYEQCMIIMTQEYAGGLQQTVIRPNFIRTRHISSDGTMADWNDYVLNSKLEERLSEKGFDYYYEFEDYDTYYIELDKFKSSGLYKIKIKERTEVLLVSTLGSWGDTVQLRISMEGYPTIERRAGRYYESDGVWSWEDWDACATIGYVDERIDYVDEKIGNIDTLLDSVLAIEQELIGEALVDTSIAVCDSYINGGNAE